MTEQERFEQHIATKIHAAKFTKVKDCPLLGWNGARPTDYVNPEIQCHWITWEAAMAQAVPDGYVLINKECSDDMAEAIAFEAGVSMALNLTQTFNAGMFGQHSSNQDSLKVCCVKLLMNQV